MTRQLCLTGSLSMNLELVGALLLAHMVADYPLQTDWMAENKHTNNDALTHHAIVHGAAVFAFVAVWVHVGLAAGLAIPVAFIHGVVDRMNLHIRWDQTAHLLTIVVLGVLM